MTKRICFICLSAYGYFTSNDSALGGAGRQLSLIAQELTEYFDVHFVVGDFGQPVRQQINGVTLHRAYQPQPSKRVWKKAAELVQLWDAIRRADADIYVYRGRPWKATWTYLLIRVLGKRWVYNLANDPNIDEQPDMLPTPLQWWFKRALTDADGIIAQTPYQARRLRERYGIESIIVPNGYPAPEVIPSQKEREHALWVGRLDGQQKRPHLYLDIVESNPSIDFLLAGPDGLDEKYNRLIRERAAELDNITDLGSVNPNDIHKYYAGAFVLVNTSRTEGFPNTFLEAWRYDTPVISLDINPARFVDPDVNGYTEGDTKRLAELVSELASDVSRRRALGEPAGEYVRSQLSIESVAEQYKGALDDALVE